MQTSTSGSANRDRTPRIMIVADPAIARAAGRALLRAEGLDVVADAGATDRVLSTARALRPEVVIVDVTPTADTGFDIARRLRALPDPPTVLITSSANRSQFGRRLDRFEFVAKADISAAAIARLTRTPKAYGLESQNP
ncbi:MAG: response regulator [Streptosporangiaceae bacterium]